MKINAGAASRPTNSLVRRLVTLVVLQCQEADSVMKGFTRDDSARIGFANSCLFHDALNLKEMQQWIFGQLERTDGTPPAYLIDLLDFDAPLAHIFKAIGFTPHWPFTEDAKDALYGIAFKRGREPIDCPFNRDEALQKLAQHPEVESMFRSEFPFINLI